LRYRWNKNQIEANHPSLLLRYGFSDIYPNKDAKSRLLKKVIEQAKIVAKSQEYKSAYLLYYNTLKKNNKHLDKFLKSYQIKGSLLTGLGDASVIETSVALHNLFGLPFIRGEALKGAIRALALKKIKHYENHDKEEWEKAIFKLFGREKDKNDTNDQGQAGDLIIYDSWWDPNSPNKSPLTLEVETVHHKKYYDSKGYVEATDFDDPVPITQIAITGNFDIYIDFIERYDCLQKTRYANFVFDLMTLALSKVGLGARVNVGYGRLSNISS